MLKVSHEELERDGMADADDVGSIVRAMTKLAEAGADSVVVTRADKPRSGWSTGPSCASPRPRWRCSTTAAAGDSLTAGIAATLAGGGDMLAALRFGAAAGAINVTRHGLASGRREEIERMAERVEITPFDDGA